MGRRIKKGSTDQSTVIRIVDSTAFTPETGVEHDTSGIALWYRREGATATAITEAALASLDAAHSDGGIEHIGDGYYRLDLPDAACATGANSVQIGGTVTGMIVIGNEHELCDVDPYDAVRMGMTALPNAAAAAAGGLPVSTAGSLDLDAKIGALTFTVSGDVDVNVQSWKGAAAQDMTGDAFARLGAPAGASVSADVASVKVDTAAILVDTGTTLDGNITAILADSNELQTDLTNGGRLDLLIDAIKAKTDNLPADPADDGDIDTQLAAIAAYIDTEVATLVSELAKVPKSDSNVTFNATALASIKNALEASGSDLDYLVKALVNKRIWTEAGAGAGTLEMFSDAGASLGTIANQVTSDGTYTTALRAVI